jgi:hypothetical protein
MKTFLNNKLSKSPQKLEKLSMNFYCQMLSIDKYISRINASQLSGLLLQRKSYLMRNFYVSHVEEFIEILFRISREMSLVKNVA